jgi:DNA polymerase-3 subunit alpha
MNALYRPGPMEYIPDFIRRKHGLEKIDYLGPAMEKILNDTYGITVYQEQVMLLSQEMAGFTKGQADSLRKAMGKKKKSLMDEMKTLFQEGCQKNGFEEDKINKIWTDMTKQLSRRYGATGNISPNMLSINPTQPAMHWSPSRQVT